MKCFYYIGELLILINLSFILGVIIYPPEISGGFFFDKVVIFNVRFFTPYICI